VPRSSLSEKRVKVKKAMQHLLDTLKREKLVIDWRRKQQSRASVRVAVEKQLDRLPDVFTAEMWQAKVDKVYQHVYDSYYGEGRSVYSTAAA
jgi:type I restriction enzyme R subunit